jgi:ATP-dependent DNA helicase RecQ
MEKPCGNCDACLIPIETWDGSEAARKALSAAYRTGQKFGVNHLIDVLLGKETDKIQQFAHGQLQVFGLGEDLDANQWRSVFRQLVARGYLTVDVSGFGSLILTEKCRPVLKGEETLRLRKDPKPERKHQRGLSKDTVEFSGEEEILWQSLRTARKKLADEQGVPPYIIFGDVTLKEMVSRQPINSHQFLDLTGVGEKKLERYGDEFMDVIREHHVDMLDKV